MPRRYPRTIVLIAVLLLLGILGWSWVAFRKMAGIPWPWKGSPQSSAGMREPSPAVISLQDSFVRVAERVKPAVVNIAVMHIDTYAMPQFDFFSDDAAEDLPSPKAVPPEAPRFRRKREATGSGVIVSGDGYILTNEHVVRGARQIRVTMADGSEHRGRVVGADPRTDIAVVKISGKDYPFAVLGDSGKIRVGEWAIAIGSPFGLSSTMTSGIVSAVRQSLPIEGREYHDLIQTDAAINQGNSGGPLCNISGEVIGINTAIYAPTGVFAGIGFAIPSDSAREVMDRLISRGRVARGWIGVEIRQVDPAVAAQFGLREPSGVLINGVIPGSPAARAGIRRGDVLTGYDGRKIAAVRELQAAAAGTPPGRSLVLRIIRDGKEMTVRLTAVEMPSEEDLADALQRHERESSVAGSAVAWKGMRVAGLTDVLAERYAIPYDEKGCVVVEVEEGSTADEAGLLPGDLIRAVNRVPVQTAGGFAAAAKTLKIADGIVFDVVRQGRPLYLSCGGKKEE